MSTPKPLRLVIISGRSGSGKSSALHSLEDLGFYCVDNLPIGLIPQLVEAFLHQENIKSLEPLASVDRLAIGVDARSLQLTDASYREMCYRLMAIEQLKMQTIYLDADNDTLLRRFSETRRKHPITSASTSLVEALELERQILSPLVTDSTIVLDTTSMSLHQLRSEMGKLVSGDEKDMLLMIQSFGFKHGIPRDSDLIFDVRCLINPHWVPQLRALTGLDQPVVEFLAEDTKVQEMRDTIVNYLQHWLPDYQHNNRRYLTVSIGCTGGQHRSVYLAEVIRTIMAETWKTQIRHRQLNS